MLAEPISTYYVTRSPISDVLFVATWDEYPHGLQECPPDVRICGVPVGEVSIQSEFMELVIPPELDNLPIPADSLGAARSGDGFIYLRLYDVYTDGLFDKTSGLAAIGAWYVDKPELQGSGMGITLLELAFKFAYAFGYAGVMSRSFDGLWKEEIEPKFMARLNALAEKYHAQLTREETTQVIIRWAKKPTYRFSLPSQSLADILPSNL